MTSLRALSLALWFLGAVATGSAQAQQLLSPAPEHADDNKQAAEARAHFTRGNELYAAGDLNGTLAEFDRAYALRPSPLLCFQIGQVAFELREFARSFRAFSQFLLTATAAASPSSTPGEQAAEQKRFEAEAMIKELEPRIARLHIETNVPGARLSVDEQLVGDAPLAEPIVLDVGTVRVRASKPGFAAVTRLVTLAGGDSISLELQLEPLEATQPPAREIAPSAVVQVPAEKAALPKRPMTRGLWAGFATAGALAIAGGVIGIYALKASSELDRKRFAGGSAKHDFAQASEHVRALAIGTDVLLGGAVVAAQTSLFVLLWRRHRPAHARDRGRFVRASLRPSSLAIEGAF